MSTRDIAVIGAGVAGLAVAARLARDGNRVRLMERIAAPRPLGAGLLLQPTGLAALARLGLHGAVLALGAPIERLEGRSIAGRAVFHLRYDDLAVGLLGLGVHRAMLHRVLWEDFAASRAALETAAEVVALRPAAGGGACPVSADGRVHARADLVIDASGAGSPLRALLGGRAARPFDFGAMWAVVPDTGFAPSTLAQRYGGARIMLGHLPVGRRWRAGRPVFRTGARRRPGCGRRWRPAWRRWPGQSSSAAPPMSSSPRDGRSATGWC